MIFKIIDNRDLKQLFDLLAVDNSVVGPVQAGTDRAGSPLYSFAPVTDYSLLSPWHTFTKLPPKLYFLPYREKLASYRINGIDWDKTVDYNRDRPIVLFGLHPCDINALNRLDKVLLGNSYPMPYYAVKRRNTFIVGTDCMPQPFCFCRSMGADTVLHGFDLFLTDLGGRCFVEVQSAAAYTVMQSLRTRPPDETDHRDYVKLAEEKSRKFTARVDTTDLTKILDMEFQSPVWKEWGERCLACGTCANVCPTCYCYGVEESVALDLKWADKTRVLYSCTLVDFAEVAGGHNFRPDRQSRIKYRYYHKHRGFVEAYEEPLCVGCGRCGQACLAGITVPEVIASVRGKES